MSATITINNNNKNTSSEKNVRGRISMMLAGRIFIFLCNYTTQKLHNLSQNINNQKYYILTNINSFHLSTNSAKKPQHI